MNCEKVIAHLPLLKSKFDLVMCEKFLKSKKELWDKDGIGPWAIYIDDCFSGWGGFQRENNEYDLALILAPNYWGYGMKVFRLIIRKAKCIKKIDSFTVLIPQTRSHYRALEKFGFIEEGYYMINNVSFIKLRYKIV